MPLSTDAAFALDGPSSRAAGVDVLVVKSAVVDLAAAGWVSRDKDVTLPVAVAALVTPSVVGFDTAAPLGLPPLATTLLTSLPL